MCLLGGVSFSPYESFNGSIDEVRIYSRALNAAEIQTLYQYPDGNIPNTNQTTFLPSDLNQDIMLILADIMMLVSEWGRSGSSYDLNTDDVINLLDIMVIVRNWDS